MHRRRRPGEVRDAIFAVLSAKPEGASASEIELAVQTIIGNVAPSSVRSYLHLNTPRLFARSGRGYYALRVDSARRVVREVAPTSYMLETSPETELPCFTFGKAKLYHADCFDWLRQQPRSSIHAVVTDPPYGLFEYTPEQQAKLRVGKGGVWRIPPSFDGSVRSPLPRFTVLSPQDLRALEHFFFEWACILLPILVPWANILVASNPLLSFIVAGALARAGLERRGELVRLVMTMRGGDRPKAAHEEFSEVSVMPRSMWEPWLLFRKPIEGRVQDNLRKWKTGGFRRPSGDKPFGDVISSAPTRKSERVLAPHPSLKPQEFLRVVVRGALPLGEGVVLDPFAGAGSTLAAAEAIGYTSIGIEKDGHFFDLAQKAIPKLVAHKNGLSYSLNL